MSDQSFAMLAAAVRTILERPYAFDWTMQGLGMLRLYLRGQHGAGDVMRLHIWDPDMAVENVSAIHDHPWGFTSTVLAGTMQNVRYWEDAACPGTECRDCGDYQRIRIRCGVGGCAVSEIESAALHRLNIERYGAGEVYSQDAEELHRSFPSRGAVTIIERHFTGADRDHANVYWKSGPWVSAEPRPATRAEVQHMTELALSRWDAPSWGGVETRARPEAHIGADPSPVPAAREVGDA